MINQDYIKQQLRRQEDSKMFMELQSILKEQKEAIVASEQHFAETNKRVEMAEKRLEEINNTIDKQTAISSKAGKRNFRIALYGAILSTVLLVVEHMNSIVTFLTKLLQ